MDDALDLRGLKCPLPALMARRALARLPLGGCLTVMADDPLAAVDIPHMCHHEGHAVESETRDGGHTAFVLRAHVSKDSLKPDCAAAGRPMDPGD
jgi:tRNA 2-thiouridine synthesizing protein A